MECPKCHSVIKDNSTVCPKCHKVLALECPNCGEVGESAVCQRCGYTILVKCAKCSKLNPYKSENCSKCGFPVKSSLAYAECESDEFASILIKFGSLKNIKKLLKSKDLYTKFFFKLKNLLFAQLKGFDTNVIMFGDSFVINLNKELSLATSSNKAVRLALKIVNAFSELNLNVFEELGTPLNLSLSILKKNAEDLQELRVYENNVKLLTVNKNSKKYLRGMQIILDQYVYDSVSKDYKTDSLYSVEENGGTVMFYEIVLDSYVLPPAGNKAEEKPFEANLRKIKKQPENESDLYSFKVFDINAKCKFSNIPVNAVFESLKETNSKIISLRYDDVLGINTATLVKHYESEGHRVLTVACNEKLNYKPWGFFEAIFKDCYNLAFHNKFSKFDEIRFKPIVDLLQAKPVKAMTAEDARFTYMECFGKLLNSLDKTVIIVENFEALDDTSIQTLELYFDKFNKIKPVFLFLTNKETSLHSKIKGLLRTTVYTEFTLQKASLDSLVSNLKSDATDFINSFYFEKIEENFSGSMLYFENAIAYLKEAGVLLDFDNKLLLKNKKSVILPKDLGALYKSRIKLLSKNMDCSLILAYFALLSSRLDFKTLSTLGIKDVEKNVKILLDSGFVRVRDGVAYLNNPGIVIPVITQSLKKDALNFLGGNILTKLSDGLDDTTLFTVLGILESYKEEYLILWRNSKFAIETGDYDAYLKNCLGFLALIEQIETDISKEDIDLNKKEVFNNILSYLYSYSPTKIYYIENMLLMDAINNEDNDKIVKLSNLMLQGALISSNYTDALGLLHNILSRLPNPTLLVDGAVNTKFLLLSLVNIEILYNIGDFRSCVDLTHEILAVLTPEILDKVKPTSFSTNLFVSHLLETCRLAGFAKLFLLDIDLDEFFVQIETALNAQLPEKDCILAIKDYLGGKIYETGNIEEASAFSKVIFLILQEFSVLKDDYKRFAQNIYQAKLLAEDLHQKEIILFCDLLIAYSYSKLGIDKKAEAIYNDVLKTAQTSAMFNIIAAAKYFLALFVEPKEALILINDMLAMIQKQDNQSKIFYALFESLYIKIAREEGITAVDIEVEEQKLEEFKESLKIFTKLY